MTASMLGWDAHGWVRVCLSVMSCVDVCKAAHMSVEPSQPVPAAQAACLPQHTQTERFDQLQGDASGLTLPSSAGLVISWALQLIPLSSAWVCHMSPPFTTLMIYARIVSFIL
jgi:hypothetical protein